MRPLPADEYRARLSRHQTALARLTLQDVRISRARLTLFLAACALGLLSLRGLFPVWLVILPVVAFAVLVVYHDRVLRAAGVVRRAIALYERGLARIEDRWIGTGESGDRFRDDEHVYANDLDIFGRGSLFELLSIARTRGGEAMLAAWLTRAAPAGEVRERQAAVDELTPALDLREALSLAGAEVDARVDAGALIAWAEGPQLLSPRWLRAVAALLTATTLATLGWLAATGDPLPFELALVVQSVVSWRQRHRIDHALHTADSAGRDLDVLSSVLARLEREEFTSPRLKALRQRLDTVGRPGSEAIGSLHRLLLLHDWEHNLMFTPIALLLLWGTHLAWAVEAWRARHGTEIRGWLDAVAELEALASLAAYRYEHPDDPFPDVIDGARASFAGEALGHPLIPMSRMVRNDVHLSGDARLLVVSGSNMSGKSTLLRTVGINTVLALAGAPVRAASLTLTPLAIGATLRIQDSLQEGRSRFYAEITRIRRLTDIARGAPPLLFLLDELFHGTNSHDRVLGAAGVLRSLIDAGAVGLITTHDLALTAVADQLAPRAANVHFDDWFEEGDLRFDYRAKPGPVTRSNAIALMRAVGLDVAETGGGPD